MNRNKIRYKNCNFAVTERVLIPEKNKTKIKTDKKRFYRSQDKYFRHETNGSLISLFNKTPDKFIVTTGKKKLNKSFDNNLFKLLQHDERNYTFADGNEASVRIFGVERKKITRNHNEETEPDYGIKPYDYRKQFWL